MDNAISTLAAAGGFSTPAPMILATAVPAALVAQGVQFDSNPRQMPLATAAAPSMALTNNFPPPPTMSTPFGGLVIPIVRMKTGR